MKITVRHGVTLAKIAIREDETWGRLCERFVQTRFPRQQLLRLLLGLRPEGAKCRRFRLRYGDSNSAIIVTEQSAGMDSPEAEANVVFLPVGRKDGVQISPRAKVDRQLADEGVDEIAVELCIKTAADVTDGGKSGPGNGIGQDRFSVPKAPFPVDDIRSDVLQSGENEEIRAAKEVAATKDGIQNKTEMKRQEKKKKKKKKKKRKREKRPLTAGEIKELTELVNFLQGRARDKVIRIIFKYDSTSMKDEEIHVYLPDLDVKDQRKLHDLVRNVPASAASAAAPGTTTTPGRAASPAPRGASREAASPEDPALPPARDRPAPTIPPTTTSTTTTGPGAATATTTTAMATKDTTATGAAAVTATDTAATTCGTTTTTPAPAAPGTVRVDGTIPGAHADPPLMPADGFPMGWTVKRVPRRSGKQKDSYWYSPVNRHRFRSKIKVKRFLACLDRITPIRDEKNMEEAAMQMYLMEEREKHGVASHCNKKRKVPFDINNYNGRDNGLKKRNIVGVENGDNDTIESWESGGANKASNNPILAPKECTSSVERSPPENNVATATLEDIDTSDSEGASGAPALRNPLTRKEMSKAFSIEGIFGDYFAREDRESGERQVGGLAGAVVTPSTKKEEKGMGAMNLWQSSLSPDNENEVEKMQI